MDRQETLLRQAMRICNLGAACAARGQLDEAERLYRLAIDITRAVTPQRQREER
jgi:hypothetical protein